MLFVVCAALFLPLVSFLGLIAFSRMLGRTPTGVIACLTLFTSFSLFISLLVIYLQTGMEVQQFSLFSFFPLQGIHADFSLHIDSLSILMTLIVTGIGFLIHVYSTGYMEHEEGIVRYFACMQLFIFSMLLLVLAGNVLVLFAGWEGVGLASYLLIGFWYDLPAAARAATKAFVINRIGDLAFLLAIVLTFTVFGTGDIAEISKMVSEKFAVGAPAITLLTLLYLIGATGKSAQLPLYAWLPDAMQGPTPVSALIHAATMVTAGVYLIVRLEDLFLLAPFTMQVVGVVGGVTSLFAALCAICQTDLKRVLAFSTVSQLGLMFLACGAGAFYSAMFHLTMHAFVKALLFLSAGNVVHMLHGTTEMAKMGGLAAVLPKTRWCFLIGAFALSGIPPLAPFFSKDLIVDHEFLSGHMVLFFIGLAASILTGVYMIRAYLLTFAGTSNLSKQELSGVKEAPKVMLIPVSILALLSVIGGMLGYTFESRPLLETFLSAIHMTEIEKSLHSGFIITPETLVTVFGTLFAMGITTWIYKKKLNPSPYFSSLFSHAVYYNELCDRVFVKPLQSIALSITTFLEPTVFTGMITGIVYSVRGASGALQRAQSGQIRSYIAWMVLGSVFLLIYFIKE